MQTYMLLTGASSGIGKAIAANLAHSYSLILCAKDNDRLKSTLQSLDNPQNHKILTCDLSNIQSTEKSIQNLLKEIKIQGFIHCAGINYVSYAKNFNYNEMLDCANVNLYSAMAINKYLLKKNARENLKNIIFISSISSQKCEVGDGFYASTKAGLDAYMKSLSLELAPNIKVNSILPGTIFETKMGTLIYNEEQKQKTLKKYPLGEGKCQDIAEGVNFLLHSRWISGQELIIDGGYST
ncbi:SDR family oxidoreductase [Helicobacter sp. 13S00477-4]|uniref:SDR family oxidoreductase n=1 Tax=Helicobacter sp. 13S00477-4 TaxID=1905759 RepID=UPI000BA717E9|nr:SDR family oxidoreductase [Helicobacter sp. 13S00477-4]PAF51511.1 hypothetical protein BKH44_05565 [Helicobacter sp. 13S00477-4]